MPMLLHAQLQALSARHEVTLVAGVGDEPWEGPAARAILGTVAHVHLADRRRPARARQRMRRRLRLAAGWACTSRPWQTFWFATPSVQTVLDSFATGQRFDLACVEDSAMAMLRLPEGVPSLLTDHDVERPRPRLSRPSRPLPQWAFSELDWRRWDRFQPPAWRRFDRVQVFTELDARTIDDLAPDVSARVRINPFGLVLPDRPDPRLEEPGNVLFIGNFTHPPNRDAATWLAREIMPRVVRAHAGARLRLVGSGVPTELRAPAADWLEVITDVPSVAPYVAAASVCVAPVRLGGGMRLKVLYALASGKAVVTTSRGAEGYARTGEAPPMIVADDAEGIAAAITQLLGDRPRRHELGGLARAFAEELHSAAAWGRRLDAVYEETATGVTA